MILLEHEVRQTVRSLQTGVTDVLHANLVGGVRTDSQKLHRIT